MKKTTLLLTLIMLVGTITSTWAAERTAPTLPTPVKFESGKSYYLYNVGTGKFLSLYSSYYPNIDTYGIAVIPEVQEDGSYTLKISNKYIGALSTSTSIENSIYKYCFFTIATTTEGYTIQRAPSNTSNYKADQYLGFVEGTANNRITPDLTEGNIVWQFMDVEKAERYFAKHKLYTALEAMNGTDYEIGYYEAVYNDAASTTDLLTEAATRLTNAMKQTSAYTFPEWNDYPILLQPSDKWKDSSNSGVCYTNLTFKGEQISFKASVDVDKSSTFVYKVSAYSQYTDCEVYINGKLVRNINRYRLVGMLSSSNYRDDLRYFERLKPGKNEVEIRFNNNYGTSNTIYIDEVGVEQTPYFEVSLLEPGSLGTEVLYNVNHLKDVRRLKIKGKMNSDDWAKINMMTSLFSLDLSEAQITEIPDYFCDLTRKSSKDFFHEIVLPEGLERIGNYAFNQSCIDSINFPTTLKTLGYYAFCKSNIKSAYMPDSTSVDVNAFYDCLSLVDVHYPKNMTSVPKECFAYSPNIKDFPLHEGIKTIGERAFYWCHSKKLDLPKSLTSIGRYAFNNCNASDSLIIHSNITSISDAAFCNCYGLVYAEFPTSYYRVEYAESPIYNCDYIKEVVFKSPTVVEGSYKQNFFREITTPPTIKVPSFLVNSYKLDAVWYNYNIEGFSTADVKDWVISQPLVLNERERFEGYPNLTIRGSGSMKINGTTAMDIDSLVIYSNGNDTTYTAKFLSNCENISIKGQLQNSYYVTGKKWYFISMPFDFKVSDVTATASNAKFVLRYYDGASRAVNGASGNWKSYTEDDVIKAGTGFILQSSIDTRYIFTALNNESKQYMVSNNEFVKALEAHPSETVANSGWNLVGNPWQSFYNIHILNFTAPITIYNVSKKTYSAYSIIDDDIAIEPNQAFFVQCPEDVSSISFPVGGRQLTSAIEKQQDAITTLSQSSRLLIDLAISCDDMSDKTRIVFNDKSSVEYETHCDASKFFTPETGVPQLYTIGDDGVQYAINERPTLDGSVKLGFLTDRKSQFTISAQRNDGMSIELTDLETGIVHDLNTSDYIFSANAGSHNDRFILTLGKGNRTTNVESSFAKAKSIKAVENGIEITGINGNIEVFSIDGRCIASTTVDGNTETIPTGNGVFIVKTSEKTAKVIVK